MRFTTGLLLAPLLLAAWAAPRGLSAQDPPGQYVGSQVCMQCHQGQADALSKTLHGKAADPRTPMAGQGCEACHGPGGKHVEDPTKQSKPRQFNKLSAETVTEVCTTCHSTGEHALWAGSKHEGRGVACTTCHSVHHPVGDKQLKKETQPKLCATCHQNIVNKLNRFNHMPVREDKLVCTSCHNTHGSANVKMLRTGTTIDQACTSCHTEKRGPMLWEHAPVSNSCVTCHDPHGSSNERMLVSKVPFLCQRCHVTSRHPPTVYSAFSIKNSTASTRIAGRGCVICHAQIHGSNSPNGKAFLR